MSIRPLRRGYDGLAAAASSSGASEVDGERVDERSGRACVVFHGQSAGIDADFFVGMADAGTASRRPVAEVPHEIDESTVRIERRGCVEQDPLPDDGGVARESAAGERRRILDGNRNLRGPRDLDGSIEKTKPIYFVLRIA